MAKLPLTASDARRAMDAGRLSARAYLDSCLARIAAREHQVGAWCEIGAARACAMADRLDATSSLGILRGIPFGVKDIIDVEGFRTGNGSAIYAAAPLAESDATVVALLRAAGAMVLGKTVATEMAGPVPAAGSATRNPHNREYSPGGSSSGSAAAVADGHVPIAIGTQTAGSVIRPAAYCGVYGFKPSFAAVARGGVKIQSQTLDTLGAFTRSMEDMALWYAAVTGAQVVSSLETPTSAPLKIGVLSHLSAETSPAMVAALASAATALTRAGEIVVAVDLPATFSGVIADQKLIQATEMARHYAPELSLNRTLLSEPLAAMLDEGARIPNVLYLEALARANALRDETNALFTEVDAWLLPAAAGAAPQGLSSTGDPLFNRMVSLMHLPAITIPGYRDSAGMPLGLQLVGKLGADEKLLQSAAQVDHALKAFLATQ